MLPSAGAYLKPTYVELRPGRGEQLERGVKMLGKRVEICMNVAVQL
jgi:hypothetical protein